MTTFTIPSDPEQADGLASELGQLATATEWKRAAIVYARVRVQDSAGRLAGANVTGDNFLTPAEYALRGIHGLRSQTTIRAYHRAWHHAVVEGHALPTNLGDEVELPDVEWNDYYEIQNRVVPPWAVPVELDDDDDDLVDTARESFTVTHTSGGVRGHLGKSADDQADPPTQGNDTEDERLGATTYSRAIQKVSWSLGLESSNLTDEQLAEALGAAQFLFELLRGETIIRSRMRVKEPTGP